MEVRSEVRSEAGGLNLLVENAWIAGDFVGFKRPAGENRHTDPAYRNWRKRLHDEISDELAFMDRRPDLEAAHHLEVCVSFESKEALESYRGDLDNILKGVMDALTGVVWKDDRVRYVCKAEIVAGVTDERGILLDIWEVPNES